MDRGYDFLFWAYNVVWIAVIAYVSFLALRLRSVGRRLDRIESRVSGEAARGSAPR